MASRVGPRSVKDATRFTSTIPHATSKTASTAASPAALAAKQKVKADSRQPGETPEQRVARLRRAHQAAQAAQISQADRLIDGSRRFLNIAHRWTITGIVLLSVVAGTVCAYSIWDMLRYNRARRDEWIAAQKVLEQDALSAARMAYMQGKATPAQIELVEEANYQAEKQGKKLPPLLGAPSTRTHFEETIQPALEHKKSAAAEGKGLLGWMGGLFGGAAATAGEEVKKGEQEAETLKVAVEKKVEDVVSQEKENQRQGGSLDRLGLDAPAEKKKSWWPW